MLSLAVVLVAAGVTSAVALVTQELRTDQFLTAWALVLIGPTFGNWLLWRWWRDDRD